MDYLSRLGNYLRRSIRPMIHRFRDTRRLKAIAEDVKRILPMLADEKFSLDDVVIDLGANRGDFSIWGLNKGAFVIAIEPHGPAFNYFTHRTRRELNLVRLQAAVSNKNEVVNVLVHPNAYQDQLGFSIRASIRRDKAGFIPYSRSLSLDFRVLIENLSKVKCLKVDIEGSESEIWESIANNAPKIEYLLMEVHDAMNPMLRDVINSFIMNNNLEDRWTANWV